MKQQIYQGDIGLIPVECLGITVDDISRDTEIKPMKNGRLLLQDGEVTGHSHHIWTQRTYLQAEAPRGGGDYKQMLRDIGIKPEDNTGEAVFYTDNNLIDRLVRNGILLSNPPVIGWLIVEGGTVTMRHGLQDGKWCGEHNDHKIIEGAYLVVGKRELVEAEVRRVQD